MSNHLIDYNSYSNNDETISKEINEELEIVIDEKDIVSITCLNSEQKHADDIRLQKVNNQEPVAFFIDNHGGSGKTYLYRAILATLISKKLIELVITSSSVAPVGFMFQKQSKPLIKSLN